MRKTGIFFLKQLVESNFKRPGFPFKLNFAVTYRCNLKCNMCNIWKKDSAVAELSLEEIEQFFNKAGDFSWISISGGEPFLRTDLSEITDIMIRYCKYLKAIHFATNAQLKNNIVRAIDSITAKNKKIKIAFAVSIDGPPDLHDRIRGKEGAWKTAIDTFICLKKMAQVTAQIGYTLSPQNIGKFEDTYIAIKDIYPEFRFDDITVNIFQKSNFYYGNYNMQDLDPDKIRTEISKIQNMDKDKLSMNNFLRRKYLSLYIRYLDTKKCPLKCKALSSTCFLDPYGNLFPCVMYDKKLINVVNMDKNLKAIWTSDYATTLSYKCSYNVCPGCWSPCDAYSTIGGSVIHALFS